MTATIIVILIIWLCFLSYKISMVEETLKNTQSALMNLRWYVNKYIKKGTNAIEEIRDEISNFTEDKKAETFVETNEILNIEANEQNEKNESIELKEQPVKQKISYNQDKSYSIDENKNSNNNSGLESIFLGNIFSIVGAIAIIIGFIIFIKLISPFIIFTPIMKTSIGFISGILMIIAASMMKTEKMKNYSEILLGTGFCLLFSTVYLTTFLFKTFPETVCLILGIAILISAYVFADRQKTSSMIAISLTGGYLNILLVNLFYDINAILSYLIFLNLLSVIFVYRNPQKAVINIINLCVTCITTLIIYFLSFGGNTINIAFPVILWCIYLIYDIAEKIEKKDNTPSNSILNWFNFSILTLFSLTLFYSEKTMIGFTLLSAGLIYGAIVYYFASIKSEKYKPYLSSMFISVLLSTLFLTSGVTAVICLSVEGLILSIILSKFPQCFDSYWILGFICAAVARIFFVDGVINSYGDYNIIFNIRLGTFLPVIMSSGLSHFLLKDKKNIENTIQVLKFLLITLIYTYIVIEINEFLSSDSSYSNVSTWFIKSMIYSIIGFVYSLQMYYLSEKTEISLFRGLSSVIGYSSLLAVLLCGYSYKPIENFFPVLNIRTVAFATAIMIALLFSKKTKSDAFKYLAVILGYILVHVETSDTISQYLYGKDYLIPIMWLLYGGTVILVGIFKNKKVLKECGILIASLTVLRIFFYEMANIEMIYKLLVLIILGVTLMFISYIYNKNKEK